MLSSSAKRCFLHMRNVWCDRVLTEAEILSSWWYCGHWQELLCQNDNFLCSQWRNFDQNDDTSVSVLRLPYPLLGFIIWLIHTFVSIVAVSNWHGVNFVVTGGTGYCRYDNLRCCTDWSWHHDNSCFSVLEIHQNYIWFEIKIFPFNVTVLNLWSADFDHCALSPPPY